MYLSSKQVIVYNELLWESPLISIYLYWLHSTMFRTLDHRALTMTLHFKLIPSPFYFILSLSLTKAVLFIYVILLYCYRPMFLNEMARWKEARQSKKIFCVTRMRRNRNNIDKELSHAQNSHGPAMKEWKERNYIVCTLLFSLTPLTLLAM